MRLELNEGSSPRSLVSGQGASLGHCDPPAGNRQVHAGSPGGASLSGTGRGVCLSGQVGRGRLMRIVRSLLPWVVCPVLAASPQSPPPRAAVVKNGAAEPEHLAWQAKVSGDLRRAE